VASTAPELAGKPSALQPSRPQTQGGTAAARAPGSLAVPQQANCRPDGRQQGFAAYMPPCVPLFTGDNGGATARGVTRDKIVVALWRSQADPAQQAALTAAGIADDRAVTDRYYNTWLYYANQHYETYKREVVFVYVEASGRTDDDVAMRADAVRIAEEVKAFAALGPSSPVMARELAARGVLCICLGSDSRTNYLSAPGMIFSAPLPMMEDHYAHMAEYIGKRLAGKPAKWAGDAALQAQTRKFGLIWTSGAGSATDPARKDARDFYVQRLSKFGTGLAKDVSYNTDLSKAGEQSTNIIAQLKAAGVSNVAFMGDALTMIFITKEATRQAYFPEWLISGYNTSDSTFFGRSYDQAQWRHAFGVSPLWLFWTDVTLSIGYVEYHHACADAPAAMGKCAQGDEGKLACCNRWQIEAFFNGVQIAGPKLTTQSFTQAMYNAPPAGGAPKVPTYYFTPEDPTAIKDFMEIYWDPTGAAQDEVGNQGVGRMMKVEGGRRYRLGDWPATEPKAFDPNGAVFTSDDPKLGQMVFAHAGHRHPPSRHCLSCEA
jgi:hypothetical protein